MRGRRVSGLWFRTTIDGHAEYRNLHGTFEYRGRLAGQVVSRTLEARTAEAAKDEVERLRSEARGGARAVVDPRLTVARLASSYLQSVAADPGYSPRWSEDVRSRVNKHILPILGRMRVDEVDAHMVRRFALGLPAGMRAKTFENIVSVASTMFTWAVAEGLVEENPVARARERFPKDLHRRDTSPFKPRALTDDEVTRSLAALGPIYRPVIEFKSLTGARVSEVIGIRFMDVDVRAGTWTVSGQLNADGTFRGAGKTRDSLATVALAPAAVAIVREQRAKAMRRGFGAAVPDAFVFTGQNGQPLSRRNVLRAWQTATTRTLGLRLRLHDLRTTFVSRLVERNVDVATAQELARHSQLTTTLNHYTRIRGDADARLERMRDALNA